MKKFGAFITNGALIALSVFMFIFMSQPYFSFTALGKTGTYSGYEYLKDISSDNISDNEKLIAVSVLFLVILASLLIIVALLNLLVNFNVIKSKNAAKILSAVNAFIALAIVVFAICAISGAAQIGKDTSSNIGDYNLTNGSAGWGVILNLILAIVALLVAVLDALIAFNKKSKKRKK